MGNISLESIRSCIIGHAIGDALGVPVEFRKRKELEYVPVTDMRGFGTFFVPAGSWSDDTSMTLCALDALAQERFSWDTVMHNFGKWYFEDAFTPLGWTFDVGNTCSMAISAYFIHCAGIEACGLRGEDSNGNGSLMRIIPFALYAPNDLPFVEQVSCLTHAHRRSQIACGIYSAVLWELIDKREVGAYKLGIQKAARRYGHESEWRHFLPLMDIESRNRESIRSGGYVVDTLEAALWCLVTTDNYRDCVLKAVNLGADTDTTATVAGGLAGVVYGMEGIPKEWMTSMQRLDFIEGLCEKAAERWGSR